MFSHERREEINADEDFGPCVNGDPYCCDDALCTPCVADREADREFDEFWDESGPDVADALLDLMHNPL